MVESSIVLPFSGGSGRRPIFDGKTRHFGDPGPHFLDSVANSKNCISGHAVNYRTGRHPWRRFLDSVVRFLNGPRLSPEKGAKVVPKVPCFAGRPVAESPRSRAPAPQVLESSIVLPFFGGGAAGATILTVKHVILTT